jgi:hypothetical protein
MASIFISHSRSDKRIINFFKETIEKVGLDPILMEEENWTHQSAGIEIPRRIRNCKCLIVLLGKFILYPSGYNYAFTHNWVGCEIGLANCKGIPVVVFEEDTMDFNDIVEFPVPLVSHYFRYTQNPVNSRYIGEVLKCLAFNIPFRNPRYPQPFWVKCPWNHCYAEYSYWNLRQWPIGERIPCPVCRFHFKPGVDKVLIRDKNSDKHMPTIS